MMNANFIILPFVFSVAFSHSLPNIFNFEIPQKGQLKQTRLSDAVNQLLSGFHFSQNSKTKDSFMSMLLNPGKLTQKVNGFTWKDCGGTAGKVTKLDISPDPIVFPGTLTVSAGIDINTTLNAPLQVSIVMEKKSGSSYIKIPCIGMIGSCDYKDICTILSQVSCPSPLVSAGIPCQCPFQKNTYNLPSTSFEVDAAVFPEGDYHLQVAIKSGSKQAGCLDVYASISY